MTDERPMPPGGSLYYARDGQPLDLWGWADLSTDDDYRRVDLTEGDGWRVSTVWIGLDMGLGWLYTGPPLIFETMAFGDSISDDIAQVRTPSEAAARVAHSQMVEACRLMSELELPTDVEVEGEG